ncbi:hypothetical protein [Mucilaginibacter sp. PAMB04168]|uniref:hypothetical protein n=1 Tax=Mucilaginibacter sp. PAMB04168 TaxID=3138567 RepID=UPI0031F6CFBE
MKKDLSLLTITELSERKKKLTTVYITLGIFMALAVVYLIYVAVTTKNYAFIAVGLGCSITLLPGFVSLTEINNEIKKRNQTT